MASGLEKSLNFCRYLSRVPRYDTRHCSGLRESSHHSSVVVLTGKSSLKRGSFTCMYSSFLKYDHTGFRGWEWSDSSESLNRGQKKPSQLSVASYLLSFLWSRLFSVSSASFHQSKFRLFTKNIRGFRYKLH